MFKEDDDAQDPAYDLFLAMALLYLGIYSVKNDEFWMEQIGGEGGRAASFRKHVAQPRGAERRRRRQTVKNLSAVQQHCEIVEKDQEDLERRELEEQPHKCHPNKYIF
jgi:hypothetical protein